MQIKKLIYLLLLVVSLNACAQNPAIKTIKVAEYSEAVRTDTAQIIDVRTADEYSGGHIPYSKNMDQAEDNFTELIKTLDKEKPVYIYCLSGGRSANAAKVMVENGFKNIINLDGGVMAWRLAGKSLVVPHGAVADAGMSLEQFNAEVAKNKNTLVEFYAVWCGPCKVLKPIVEEIGNENKDKLTVIYVDVDKNKMLADSLKIASIPKLQIYKDGKKTWDSTGVVSKATILKKLKF
jgi:thioredoxin 1